MAKVKSLFRVSGNVGDVNLYEKDGQKYMRQATSLDKERIATAPEFERTRENNREFGGLAVVGKALRVGLAGVLKRYADNRFGNRLTSIFKRIQKAATVGARGQRPIEVLANKAKLVGKSLDKNEPLEMVFVAPYTVTPNVDRNTVTLDIPIFDVFLYVTAPPATTHFKFVLVVTALSDHYHDVDEGSYSPVNPDLNSLSTVVSTAALPMNLPLTAAVQLVAALPGLPLLPATCGLVTCVGIEFYQTVTGNLYFLAESNGMKIVNIF